MRKTLVIFFCLQILSGNAFGMELMKLPFLFQHYFEHEKHDHPDLSFSEYLQEHYLNESHEDEEKGHCDEDLPFNHCHDCCSHITTVISFLIPETIFPIAFPVKNNEDGISAIPQFLSNYHCPIWQPPQLG